MLNTEELTKNITIHNDLGLHARPAAILVEKASHFQSEIYLVKDDLRINAKSIMGVLMLSASKGTVLILSAKGEDAKEALTVLGKLLESSFDG